MQQNKTVFDEEFDLLKLVQSLIKYWYFVLGWVVLFFIIAGIYLLSVKPTYRANALIQVEKKNSGAILTASLDSLLETSSEIKDEIELLRSRKVIGVVMEKLDLATEVSMLRFPVLGHLFSIFDKASDIKVNHFDTATDYSLGTYVLEVVAEEKYVLYYNDKQVITGVVGKRHKGSGISIEIDNIQAKVGDRFEINKNNWIYTYQDIIKRLSTKQDGKGSEVLHISFDSTDPLFAKAVLDEIIISYQQQGIDRQAEEIDNTLRFLHNKLPEIADVQRVAEERFNRYRQSEKSVDLTLETKSILEKITQSEAQLQELRLKETEISKLYTRQHPVYRSLQEQINTLHYRQEQLNEQVKKMPATQQEVLRLMQDAQVNQERFVALQNKEQELKVLRAGIIGNVRIIDAALTDPKPVAPKKIVIIIASIFLGGLFGVLHISFVIMLRRKNIKTPNDVEKLGVDVLSCIQKDNWLVLQQEKNKRLGAPPVGILAQQKPESVAIESIRSLKTSIYLKLLSVGKKSPVVMISGASPAVGKSFVSLNLAYVATENQKHNRVLLIDADMRLGHIHETMGLNSSLGLFDYLSGSCDIDSIVQRYGNIDFIACGDKKNSTYSTSLLMQDSKNSLQSLITWAEQKEYSLIIIDTPPVLALSDAILIGYKATLNILVIHHRKDSLRDVEECLKRFHSNNIKIAGTVLNYFDEKEAGLEGYSNYQYHYVTN